MHSLVGVFIKSEKEEHLEGTANTIIYPFKIIFPVNKVRVFYCRNRDDRSKWIASIKTAVGYSSIDDFYDIQGDLGKGKFGQVKLAVHKKTQKKVAIKVIKKKNMTLKELEL
jgi:serine/threonine protein kinase